MTGFVDANRVRLSLDNLKSTPVNLDMFPYASGQSLPSKHNASFLGSRTILSRSREETLEKYQENPSSMITYLILMTFVID